MDKSTMIGRFIESVDIEKFVWRYYINTFTEGWSMPDFHHHRAVELIHVLDGYGFMKFSSDVEKLGKNNCLLIMPECRHQFYVDDNHQCTLINLHFIIDDTPLTDLNEKEGCSLFPGIVIQNDEYMKFSDSVQLGAVMQRIVSELSNKQKDYALCTSLCFGELFIELSRVCENHLRSRESASKQLTRKVIDYIDLNLAEDISPKTIAQALHFTPSYLMHMFKDAMDVSLMEYVRIKRIEKSKSLLICSSETISHISQKVGISNSQHFSSLFKKYTSMSPKEYRKMAMLHNHKDKEIYK